MSGWDEIYGLSLRKIVGDNGVKLPPPSFSAAIKVSDSKDIDVSTLKGFSGQDLIPVSITQL